MRTIEQIKSDIKDLSDQIYMAECADNTYAISGRMDANNQRMRELNNELKEVSR